VGLTHFDDARTFDYELGHLRGRWTMLGESAGSRTVGVRRIQIPLGSWSTPAHEHGRSEEIFYVLSGRGISWQAGRTAEIRTGDAILYAPRRGAHTIRAEDDLDVLAFGTREYDESLQLPRLELSLVGRRGVQSIPGVVDGVPLQFAREAESGPPETPGQPGERPINIVNLEDLEPVVVARPKVERTRRNFGRRLGSERAGLQHVVVAPGMQSAPLHCHSIEEEIFIVLEGDGVLVLEGDHAPDGELTPIRPGHVVVRPPSTGVSHAFRAGQAGLTYLAYGSRDPGDICYYPRSNKIAFRGVHLTARLEKLDYWDGED
jgi:uncharacterized cupin superfamily protein